MDTFLAGLPHKYKEVRIKCIAFLLTELYFFPLSVYILKSVWKQAFLNVLIAVLNINTVKKHLK